MFIAVEDDGTLHRTAFTEFREEFTEHPDTHTIYYGYRIPLTPLLIQAAVKLHSAIPQVGVINWNLILDEEGMPVLIEANTFGGGIWLFQMAHGKGIFGKRTDEILQWTREQKSLKKSQRSLG